MSVAADYARAIDTLRRPLPAYVSYVQHERVRGLGNSESTSRIVVRTSDKTVVHGKTPTKGGLDRALFQPECYRPTAEKTAERDGHTVVVFSLAPTCDASPNSTFNELVVEQSTMQPLEATGRHASTLVAVNLFETFTIVRGHSVPASINVDLDGSGIAFWLKVHAAQTYSRYAFHATDPG